LKNSSGPFNIEIFAGSPTDNNATFFYDGAMSVLKQYIDDGKLIVGSGQVERLETAIAHWSRSGAEERMMNLLNGYYSDGEELHAILSPNDGLAAGITEALKKFGYADHGKPFPLLTGQDSELENVRAILNGEQAMTVFKDTRTLADRTFRMIDDILLNRTPETNDSTTYNNNVKFVPTFMCRPVLVTIDNYSSVLIDSGYYDILDLQ
ncbi:MAG: substrate-binding domain-containing protein, partial [Synergistaceae bacterium]|nr:substrate-binding domain-containing protein [Synergistaceae bacterium]